MIVYNFMFWFALISLFVFILERLFPWRKQQPLNRPQLLQDLFWWLFNGFLAGFAFGFLQDLLASGLNALFERTMGKKPESLALLAPYPLPLQIIFYLLIADFLEWCVHNLLHRVPFLWKLHRVHHSIKVMDWIGNIRYHWSEPFIYNAIKHIPLGILLVSPNALLSAAIFATFIGFLNHSNLKISWGPLKYVFNSPRMHIWHHEKKLRGKAGNNFAVVFSLWDWIFRTAYFPKDSVMPDELGFKGEERVPDGMAWRFFLPWHNKKG